MNKQLKSILALSIGLATFFTSLGQFLIGHKEWQTVLLPEGIGHICLILAGFLAAFIGALNYQMPRNENKEYDDRITDKSLYERSKIEMEDKEK